MRPKPRMIPNPVVARRYFAGAALLTLLATGLGGAGKLLLWPAVSMAVVALGSVMLGGGIYGKRNGRVAPWAAVLLAPTRLGQWLSLLYYRRQCAPWNEVVPGLYIGRRLDPPEAEGVIALGARRVVDLAAEFSEPRALVQLRYLSLPVPDLTAPTPAQLQEGVAFIRDGLKAGEPVYVHCKIGYSRSAALAAAALLDLGECATPEEAIAHLRQVRPAIVIRPETRDAIDCFSMVKGASQLRPENSSDGR